MLNSHAARAMTRLTVDQWQSGVFRDLVAVDRMLEVRVEFVVGVATGQTVLVADIVGIKISHQDGFVISDRCYRL